MRSSRSSGRSAAGCVVGGPADGGIAISVRSGTICNGMKAGISSASRAPERTCLRQDHSTLRLTSCRRATSAKLPRALRLGVDPQLILDTPLAPMLDAADDFHPVNPLRP